MSGSGGPSRAKAIWRPAGSYAKAGAGAMSVRVRLTLWYTAVLAVTLIIFGVGIYSLLSQILHGQLEAEIKAGADQINSYILSQANPVDLMVRRQVELPPVDVFSSSDTFVQILDRNADVRTRSANLGSGIMPIRSSAFDQNMAGTDVTYTLVAGTTVLRIYSAPIRVNDPLQGEIIIGAVQVGKSVASVEGMLQTTAYALVIGIALMLVLAAGIGALMARAALRPIDRLTQAARAITEAQDLSSRLPEVPTQDELARLTDTFNEMLGRLEALFQQQQRLVADVSHELRTPLTTLRGNLDLLKRGEGLDDEDVRDMLATMEGELSRMSRLVSDLLLLAKADAGVQLEKQIVEMDTVLLDVYRQALLMADGVRVNIGHEDQATVLGDRDRLYQLLLNLADNAVKYTPAGGEVWLSLYRHESWIKVTVSDTGVGIASEDLPHLFERFYRADRARSWREGGAGLGLSIARWIAEAHGGNLTVESEPGRGSTFTLWLRPWDDKATLRAAPAA